MKRSLLISAIYFIVMMMGCSDPKAPFSTNKEPVQENYTGNETFTRTLSKGSVTILPVATYHLAGVVMSKREYSHGWGAEIMPFDLAVVWGRLSHPVVKKLLSIHHDNTRLAWFSIKGNDPPVTEEYLMSHGSNNHLIPATETIRKALGGKVGTNDKILLEGYLVNVDGTFDGQPISLRTSISRTDIDRGACEIIYVTSLRVGFKTYR